MWGEGHDAPSVFFLHSQPHASLVYNSAVSWTPPGQPSQASLPAVTAVILREHPSGLGQSWGLFRAHGTVESQGLRETQTPPKFCSSPQSQTKRYRTYSRRPPRKKPPCLHSLFKALQERALPDHYSNATHCSPDCSFGCGLRGDRDLVFALVSFGIPLAVHSALPCPGTPERQEWKSLESGGHKLTVFAS